MGWIAGATGVLFALALVLLAAFFATKNERFDRLAEWCFVAFGVLAIPTIVTTAGRLPNGGLLMQAATVAGLAGAVAVGLGELGSSLKIVDFRRIAPIVTLGFFAFLAWIGVTSVVIVTGGVLPLNLGWLGIATIAAGGLIVGWMASRPGVLSGRAEPPMAAMVAFFVPMAGIVAWMIWLGSSL